MPKVFRQPKTPRGLIQLPGFLPSRPNYLKIFLMGMFSGSSNSTVIMKKINLYRMTLKIKFKHSGVAMIFGAPRKQLVWAHGQRFTVTILLPGGLLAGSWRAPSTPRHPPAVAEPAGPSLSHWSNTWRMKKTFINIIPILLYIVI